MQVLTLSLPNTQAKLYGASTMNDIKTYKIERVDPFGQGVALGEVDNPESDKVTFIPKTLSGEVVKAEVVQVKGKKV